MSCLVTRLPLERRFPVLSFRVMIEFVEKYFFVFVLKEK